MVSFQCNGCGDVLTKPKLDKHRDMCHSSFDCIDCSKRFESPADYKGHTSCISEAEKYQKTLYNGGKQNGPERNSKNQRSRQQGGGRQWGNNQSQWQQRNVNRATGANDTPLGTPARMSPVNDTPTADENTQKDRPAEIPKKRKAEQETTESNGASEPAKKKKKQKNTDGAPETTEASIAEAKSRKKCKSTPGVMITEERPQGRPGPVEDGNAQKEPGEAKKKKREREKKAETARDGKKEGTKEKRRKKDGLSSSGQEPGSNTVVDATVTVTVRPLVTEIPSLADTGEPRSTKKKSKRKVTSIDQAPSVSTQAKPPSLAEPEPAGTQGDQAGRKKKKKRQSSDDQDSDGKQVDEGNDGTLLKEKRKEKKKKHRSEGQAVSIVE